MRRALRVRDSTDLHLATRLLEPPLPRRLLVLHLLPVVVELLLLLRLHLRQLLAAVPLHAALVC